MRSRPNSKQPASVGYRAVARAAASERFAAVGIEAPNRERLARRLGSYTTSRDAAATLLQHHSGARSGASEPFPSPMVTRVGGSW
jgi:hypothetical protein